MIRGARGEVQCLRNLIRRRMKIIGIIYTKNCAILFYEFKKKEIRCCGSRSSIFFTSR